MSNNKDNRGSELTKIINKLITSDKSDDDFFTKLDRTREELGIKYEKNNSCFTWA